MRIRSLLAVMLLLGVFSVALADSAVTRERGKVIVDRDSGEPAVATATGVYFPNNLHGLMRSGQVELGDIVTLKITTDRKKNSHRGHVTVLK